MQKLQKLQKLRNSPVVPGASAVQPGMPVLRRKADSVAGSFTHSRQRVQGSAAGSAGLVAQAGAQRGCDTGVGQGAAGHPAQGCANWPGRGHGVRQPDPCETPLSWAEVMHGVRLGLIGWGWRAVEVSRGCV
jgi:hypothetical protein